ncbi:sterol desaturase family protein [Colwellia sp. MEBiC06753]
MSFIVTAIPFFLLLIIIELVVDRIRGTHYYRFNDALSSLSLGIFSRISGILMAMIPLSAYFWIYQHYAIFQFPNNEPWLWLLAFIAYDLGYYWVHRFGHRIAIMWGSHVVHHSSEEYNLTTALRQTGTPSAFGWLIFLPLAFIGISPYLLVACGSLNLIYQFWVHTRHINKLPAWFEAIFVTPSHHRVHHALNRDYIDKNFAGVFIVWDKLFGSFQTEKPDVDIVYGVSHQLNSWNPIWANIQVYWYLLLDALHTKRWQDKVKLWFKPPGWRPQDVSEQAPRQYITTKTISKYETPLPKTIKYYLAIQFISCLALVFVFMLNARSFASSVNLVLCLIGTYNLVVISAIQAQKGWSIYGEPLRLVVTSAALWLLLASDTSTIVFAGILSFSISSMLIFTLIWQRTAKLRLPNPS